MLNCPKCTMQFTEEVRLQRHLNTHTKKEAKGSKSKQNNVPDFDKPDFSQVM